jgi:hypothetical protein
MEMMMLLKLARMNTIPSGVIFTLRFTTFLDAPFAILIVLVGGLGHLVACC